MSGEILPGAAARALAVFGAFFQGRDDEVAADFDETVRAQMPVARIGEIRQQLQETLGDYRGAGEPSARQLGEHTVVDVPLEFEAGPMKGRIAYDQDSRIAGIFVLLRNAA